MKDIRSAEEIMDFFSDWEIVEGDKTYLKYHSRRFEYLLLTVDRIIEKIKKVEKNTKINILDIGTSYQTVILRETLLEVEINSLGFFDKRFKLRKIDKHFEFDLNDSQFKNKWPKAKQHNIIILAEVAEVIEHLYTSPKLVLDFLSTLLKPGGFLISRLQILLR